MHLQFLVGAVVVLALSIVSGSGLSHDLPSLFLLGLCIYFIQFLVTLQFPMIVVVSVELADWLKSLLFD